VKSFNVDVGMRLRAAYAAGVLAEAFGVKAALARVQAEVRHGPTEERAFAEQVAACLTSRLEENVS
jgi:hypothetical protein